MLVPDRRTCIVLGSLLGAMTLASGLLFLLEPGPVLSTTDISLTAIDQPGSPQEELFNVLRPLSNWSAVVVHGTGTTEGSADALHAAHVKLGYGGLGYHFVIHNGRGGADGEVVPSPRWRNQYAGNYCRGADADWFNKHGVGICLVGDFDRHPPTDAQKQALIGLVRRLQDKLMIPSERVVLPSDGPWSVTEARFFPVAAVRRELVNF